MDEFFTEQEYSTPHSNQFQPPNTDFSNYQAQNTLSKQPQAAQVNNFDFTGYSSTQPQSTYTYNEAAENDFNQFQQDETTKRIREEEERLQNSLRQKSQKEWNDKNQRITQGRIQLSEYTAKKEQEKQERARENIQKEEQLRHQNNKLKVQEGWYKVISSINVRQGEHKGKKDTNRMREAILRRREDQSGR